MELKGIADTQGDFGANAAARLGDSAQAVLQSRYNAKLGVSQMTGVLQYVGGGYCGTVQALRQNREKTALAADWVHQLDESVALGGRVVLDREKRDPDKDALSGVTAALAAQYAHPQGKLLATCTSKGKVSVHVSRRVCHYNKPGQDNVGLAAEYTYDWKTGRSHTLIGWDFLLPNSQAVLKGTISGSGVCKGIVTERLNASTLLGLSAEVDHYNTEFKFGLDVQVGTSAPSECSIKTSVLSPDCFDPLRFSRWRVWQDQL